MDHCFVLGTLFSLTHIMSKWPLITLTTCGTMSKTKCVPSSPLLAVFGSLIVIYFSYGDNIRRKSLTALFLCIFAANKALEKKVSEGEELKTRLEAELREKVKKMEKELENATMKAAGKHCCKNMHTHFYT